MNVMITTPYFFWPSAVAVATSFPFFSVLHFFFCVRVGVCVCVCVWYLTLFYKAGVSSRKIFIITHEPNSNQYSSKFMSYDLMR